MAVSYHHLRQRPFAPIRQRCTGRDKAVPSHGRAETA